MKERSIVLTIQNDIICGTGKSGVAYAVVTGITKGQDILSCIAFSNVAKDLEANARVGMSLSLLLKQNENNDKPVIISFHIQELNKTSSALNNVTKKDLRLFHAYQARLGLVRASRDNGKVFVWKEKDDCVLVSDAWYEKIEIILQMLGGKETTKRLLGHGIKVSLDGNNTSTYREWRDETIRELGY